MIRRSTASREVREVTSSKERLALADFEVCEFAADIVFSRSVAYGPVAADTYTIGVPNDG